MREILFRGKRCDNGEWVQGFYVRAEHHWHKHGVHKDWIVCGASANGGWFALHNKYAVKAETVGQFTGLTDKNGRKVFEGDILHQYRKYRDEYYGECVVEYGAFNCSCCDGVYGWYLDGGDIRDFGTDEYGNGAEYEVCGNIHDNPENLEGAEDGK